MNRKPSLVLVDDDPEDRIITRDAFEENVFFEKIEAVPDGKTLKKYLSDSSAASGHNNTLILLDLHMPKQSGLQVLKELKASEAYNDIPVVIYTGSNNRQEVESCYRMGATACVLKPSDYNDIIQLGQALKDSWAERLANLSEFIPVL